MGFEAKRKAKDLMKGNWKSIIKSSLLISLLAIGMSLFVFYNENESSWSIITSSISTIFGSIYIVSLNKYFRDNGKVKNMTMDKTFGAIQSGGDLVDLIVLSVIQYILIFLWTLLFVVPGIIKSFSYSQSINIYFDYKEAGRKIGYMEAITKSRELMNGNKMDFFVLSLRFIPIILLATILPIIFVTLAYLSTAWISTLLMIMGMITFTVGMLYVFNYTALTYSIYYRGLYMK